MAGSGLTRLLWHVQRASGSLRAAGVVSTLQASRIVCSGGCGVTQVQGEAGAARLEQQRWIWSCRGPLSSQQTEVREPSSGAGAGAVAGAGEEGAQSGTASCGGFFDNLSVDIVGDGAVGLVTLNRPKALNALSKALLEELVDVIHTFQNMTEIGAIVITGNEKAFAAGADIKELQHGTVMSAFMDRLTPFTKAARSLPSAKIPLIAAVSGYALGGGCELAMLCDMILAGETAVFGQPEVKLGIIPGIGGTQRLIREVGKSRAMEMVLTGEYFMKAREACDRGLVSRVVPGTHQDVVNEAIELGKKIAQLSRPVVAMAKEALNTAYETSLQEGLKQERVLFCSTFGLEDQKEGTAAFVAKRQAKFSHK